MAKLKAYDRQQIPPVQPSVNYYDGSDLYKIASTAIQLDADKSAAALSDALAEFERWTSEENEFKLAYPDSYHGDLDKIPEAEKEQDRYNAAAGDPEAQARVNNPYAAYPNEADRRHESTYEERRIAKTEELEEKYGLKRRRADSFRNATYRSGTAMAADSARKGDIRKDEIVLDQGMTNWAAALDAQDWELAFLGSAALLESGSITQAGALEMDNATRLQMVYDDTEAGMQLGYERGDTIAEIRKNAENYINNAENFEGTGTTEDQRQAFVDNQIDIFNGITKERMVAAEELQFNEIRTGYNAATDFNKGVGSVAAVMAEIENLQKLQANNANAQHPDKMDDGTIQNTIDYLFRTIAPDAEGAPRRDDQAILNMHRAIEATKIAGRGNTPTQIMNSILAIEVEDSNGNLVKMYPEVAAEYFESSVPIYEDGISRLNKFMDSSTLDPTKKVTLRNNLIDRWDDLGIDITQSIIDNDLMSLADENVAELLGGDGTEGNDNRRSLNIENAGMSVKTRGFGKGEYYTAPTSKYPQHNNDLNTYWGEIANNRALISSPSVQANVLAAIAKYPEMVADQNGQLLFEGVFSDSLLNSAELKHFGSANPSTQVVTGYSKGDLDNGIPSAFIATTVGGGTVMEEDRNGDTFLLTEMFFAAPDINPKEEGFLGLDIMSEAGDTFFIKSGMNDNTGFFEHRIMKNTPNRLLGASEYFVRDVTMTGTPEADAYIESRTANYGVMNDTTQQQIRLGFMVGGDFADPEQLDLFYDLSKNKEKDEVWLDLRFNPLDEALESEYTGGRDEITAPLTPAQQAQAYEDEMDGN